MDPRWCFSDEAIDEYLRGAVRKGWDVSKIGALTEAFAVAGCNAAGKWLFCQPCNLLIIGRDSYLEHIEGTRRLVQRPDSRQAEC